MTDQIISWNPASGKSWADILGLVQSSMFGSNESAPIPVGEHSILLDGARASFAFSHSNDKSLIYEDAALSWSWSSHVGHSLIINSDENLAFLRRWDNPGSYRKFRIPERGQGAVELLNAIESAPLPRTPDVIRHVLSGFRMIRQCLYDAEPLYAIQLLNGFLLAAQSVREGRITATEMQAAKTAGDFVQCLNQGERELAKIDEMPAAIRQRNLGILVHVFLDREPRNGCQLHPSLLFRHAASKLYQEAHLQIERGSQSSFPGMEITSEPVGRLPNDVRFTPANLARALVQRALRSLRNLMQKTELVILDPACGSGIFLQECLRELAQQEFPGMIKVVGYDKSPISTYIAEFCLKLTCGDLPSTMRSNVEIDIQNRDAIQSDWILADLVLMNPPFIPWPNLPPADRQAVSSILGDLGKGHVDLAMAFLLRAFKSLKSDGVLASVLPVALLGNESGARIREQIFQEGELLLVGRFEGYKYFQTSMVETAFIVLRRNGEPRDIPRRIDFVIAEEGAEDTALRKLRLADPNEPNGEKVVEIFSTPAEVLPKDNWTPQRQKAYKLKELLLTSKLPVVSDIFNVHQGIRTGQNDVFIVSTEEYAQFGEDEKQFFRPAAGQGTLSNGTLEVLEYVFYPYGPEGLRIKEENELLVSVPTYYKKRLLPNRPRLEKRYGVKEVWWTLAREREWQHIQSYKIVSKYFGLNGSFAYDDTGQFVVLQGHSWLWKSNILGRRVKAVQSAVHETRLPWAYLAILNSQFFLSIIDCYCPRVQGGQYNLSTRFVDDIPIPNLADLDFCTQELQSQLAEYGKLIHGGKLQEIDESLNRSVAKAYKIPLHVLG